MSYPTQNLTANGDTKVELGAGRYALYVAGTFGSGTLAVKWYDGVNTPVAFPDASFTAAGGVEITVGAVVVILNLSGATNPDLTVTITKIP